MSETLINGYEIGVASPECHPGSDRLRAFVSLQDDIGEALPYLNAELGGYDYYHRDRVLLWASKGKIYAFRPHEIAIAPVRTSEEAAELAASIIATVNDIWRRRGAIEPKTEGRKSLPNVLDLYKLLPKTNCKVCGYTTCMAFAAALRADSTKSALCPALAEEDYLALLSSV